LLSSGRVLIAGGDEELPSGGMVNPTSAELYDPATGTFSSTGSMSSGQARAAATLLADGRVLIAGGSVWSASPGYAVSVSSAEIYDPSSGAFHSVGPMASAREDPVAALLADGSALVAGGRSASGGDLGVTLSSVELFDPSTERFTAGPSMATDRAEATTSRPPDGRILIAGGYELAGGGYYYLASSEIYEPGSGSFAEGPAMVAGRSGARSTTLQDGSVLIAGGFGVSDTGFGGLYSAELYRP
jgi:hypothetical protein